MSVPYVLLNHFPVASVKLEFFSMVSCQCFNGIEGVRIPCCANCIQIEHAILCTYLGELPHFILKHHLAVIIVFDVTWYLFVLNNIEGVMISCLCTLYFN
jgi:hypothetical protein